MDSIVNYCDMRAYFPPHPRNQPEQQIIIFCFSFASTVLIDRADLQFHWLDAIPSAHY